MTRQERARRIVESEGYTVIWLGADMPSEYYDEGKHFMVLYDDASYGPTETEAVWEWTHDSREPYFRRCSDGVVLHDCIGWKRIDSECDARLSCPIRELELSAKIKNAFYRRGMDTVGDVTAKSREEIMRIRGLGTKYVGELEELLGAMGLSLREEEYEGGEKRAM